MCHEYMCFRSSRGNDHGQKLGFKYELPMTKSLVSLKISTIAVPEADVDDRETRCAIVVRLAEIRVSPG